MKFAPILLFSVVAWASAQDRVAVTFKVFPPNYDILFQGERLPYDVRGENLRTYALPEGATRVNLTAPLSVPRGVDLDIKAGMPLVQAKLEPRQGALALLGEAATGDGPRSIAFSADGKHLYVALLSQPGADVYEIPSLKKTGHLTPPDPSGGSSDIMTVGSEVWVVGLDGRVMAFDAATLAYKTGAPLTGGGNAYLADVGGHTVAINWDSGLLVTIGPGFQPTASLTLNGSVRGFSFANGIGYASLFDRGQIALIDSSWKVKTLWNVGRAPRPVAAVGSHVFVGDMSNATVLVLDTAGKLVNTVAVASNPHQMTVSKDQSLVAVASRGKNNPDDYQRAGPEFGKVTLFLASGAVAGSVWGRNQPTGLDISPDNHYLAFTDLLDNNVELYRIKVPSRR
jgi:DNA-binding beta-propeller fold protein YncE